MQQWYHMSKFTQKDIKAAYIKHGTGIYGQKTLLI